jgi:UDP-N-acetylglucosamine--N-acetylmuramyl-(pentapeptide) pyrophosphoryl-undecaprenol N-acetylglucosamine transferase
MRLLIAGGGTGGHIYPALAVARSLRASDPEAELSWVGGRRGLEGSIVRAAGIPIRRLVLRSLRSTERSIHLLLDPIRLGLSVPQAAAILARLRPAAIFTTGGYVAIPILLVARPLGIPTVLWEGNVIPGRSVRATARLASVVATSFPETSVALALPDERCYLTGTPIREFGAVDPDVARARFGVPPGDRLLLIFGGSQAVRRFNGAVAEALPRLVERVHVVHVTGDAGYADALTDREALPPDRRDRYRPYPFLGAEMADALVAADLIVGRAGSSTLAEATALGKPLVVVPYPHAAGHQQANARRLVDSGAGRLIADEAFDAATLLDAAALLDDPQAHARMAAASRALGRPGAAAAVAELVLAAAERRPWPDRETVDRRSREALA